MPTSTPAASRSTWAAPSPFPIWCAESSGKRSAAEWSWLLRSFTRARTQCLSNPPTFIDARPEGLHRSRPAAHFAGAGEEPRMAFAESVVRRDRPRNRRVRRGVDASLFDAVVLGGRTSDAGRSESAVGAGRSELVRARGDPLRVSRRSRMRKALLRAGKRSGHESGDCE